MEKRYKVVFVYPDGHIEEVDDIFTNGRDALEYGNNLLGQVINTEKIFAHPHVDEDDFFHREYLKNKKIFRFKPVLPKAGIGNSRIRKTHEKLLEADHAAGS